MFEFSAHLSCSAPLLKKAPLLAHLQYLHKSSPTEIFSMWECNTQRKRERERLQPVLSLLHIISAHSDIRGQREGDGRKALELIKYKLIFSFFFAYWSKRDTADLN